MKHLVISGVIIGNDGYNVLVNSNDILYILPIGEIRYDLNMSDYKTGFKIDVYLLDDGTLTHQFEKHTKAFERNEKINEILNE